MARKRFNKGGIKHTGKKSIKQKQKDTQKYYTKLDVFLSRMASILKVPTGTVKGMFSERAVTTIRINKLSGDPDQTYTKLIDMGADLKIVPWSADTYTVSNMDKSDLAETSMYKEGYFYIQNLSSMIPAIVLNPEVNDEVLDMCAAPGSKTTQMAAMLNNKGKIVANDADTHRAQKLVNVIEMFNVRNAEVRHGNGENIGKREEGHYSKILLDAPCSGEGLIYLRGEKPLRFWNIKKVKPFANIQKRLIESAFQSLKKGGVLVYSTCTLEPDENEGVITHLLNKYDNADLQEIDLFDSEEFKEERDNVKRGIKIWNENVYSPEASKTYRILPSGKMMGFFVAKIIKK